MASFRLPSKRKLGKRTGKEGKPDGMESNRCHVGMTGQHRQSQSETIKMSVHSDLRSHFHVFGTLTNWLKQIRKVDSKQEKAHPSRNW